MEPKLKTFKPVDYSEILYFAIMAIVSTAIWLNIPIPFEIDWMFIPMYFFAIFTPYYIFAIAIVLIYSMIKRLQTKFNEKGELSLFNRFMQLFGYLFGIFIIGFGMYLLFPFLYILIDIVSDIEIQTDLGALESFIFLIRNDSWVLFSFIVNCLFHIPRLILIFQYGMLTDNDIKKMEKSSKTRFKLMRSRFDTYLKPVGALIIAIMLGMLDLLLIPFALMWLYWSYRAKKTNRKMLSGSYFDGIMGSAIFILSLIVMLWIGSIFGMKGWSFMPIAIVYSFINIKFILDDTGMKI
jgi:hypothetical protein